MIIEKIRNTFLLNYKKVEQGCNLTINGLMHGSGRAEKFVIGAGSVVTKSIPKDELWAGNPAKLIRKINLEDSDE